MVKNRPVVLYAVVFFILGALLMIPLSSGNTYIYGGGGGLSAHNVSYHSDVDTTGASNGEVLKYNGSHWVPGTDLTGAGAETDPWFNASAAYHITTGLMDNWNTSFGWGNHALQNYLDLDTYPDTDTDDTDDLVDSDFGSAGLMKTDGLGGYSVITDRSTDWTNVYTLCYTTLGIDDLTSGEVDQLENIGIQSISAAEWGYVANMQSVSTSADPNFDDLSIDDLVLADDDTIGDITTDTSDASDIDRIGICGGGVVGYTRGGYMILYGNENAGSGSVTIQTGSGIGVFPQLMLGIGGTNGLVMDSARDVGINDAVPTYQLELPNTAGYSGEMRAYDYQTYSDIRCKYPVIENLPENMVRSFCENVSTGVWVFAFKDCYQDENGTIYIGEANYSNLDFGIPAQYLFNWINNTERFGQYAERLAHTVVYKPEDETVDFWSVNYRAIFLIYVKYSEFLNEDIKENKEHTIHIEDWLEAYTPFTPLEWD